MKRYTHNLLFQTNVTTAWMQEVESRRERRQGNLPAVISSPVSRYGAGSARNLALLVLITLIPSAYADDLGRLFTTPEQRAAMEKLRHQKPAEIITVPEIAFEEPVVEEEKPVIGGITVNGLVYRKGGKSTAWINSANTFEGNFGNEYIQIDAQSIKPEDIEIVIPVNEKKINLKTGQTYDPETEEISSFDYVTD